MNSKKGISPFVTIALLLIISVISIIQFQTWFQTFENSILINAEQKSSLNNFQIEDIVGTTLYIKNLLPKNITINLVKISGVDCNINQNISSGITDLDISNCNSIIPAGKQEILVYTNEGMFSKYLFISKLNSNSQTNSCNFGNSSLDFIFNNDVCGSFVTSINMFGAANWSEEITTSTDGSSSLENNDITHNQYASFTINISTNSKKYLTFDWKVSAEYSDFIGFCFDKYFEDSGCTHGGGSIMRMGNIRDWYSIIYPIDSGDHILTWYFSKDGGGTSPGTDSGYVDNIQLIDLPIISSEIFSNEVFPSEYVSTENSISYPWFSQSLQVLNGNKSYKSGAIPNGGISYFKINISLSTPKNLSFDWKVNSETNYDYLGFCFNKSFGDSGCTRGSGSVSAISGSVEWTNVNYSISSAGNYYLTWYYAKDAGAAADFDTGWVDNIRFLN